MQTPPGWYRDPTNPAFERWWDGTEWGQSVRAASVVLTPRMHAVWSPPAVPAVPGASGAESPVSAGASRTRTIAAVIGVVLVLVALIVMLAVVRNGDTGTLPTRSDPAPVPTTGNDFVESSGAYSLRVGDAWEEAQFAEGAAWYTGTGDRSFRDNVVIIVEGLPAAMSLATYVDVGMRSATRRGLNFDEQSRMAVVLSDGAEALVIDSFSEQQGFELGHRLLVAVHDKIAVTVTFTSESKRFDESVAFVDEYLRTLSVR